jgi:hypothetical protein
MIKSIVLSAASVALLAVAAPAAQAVEYQQNASGTCNGALPIFEQSLRFRPLALANTGSSNAFVSCTSENLFNNPVTLYGARIHNTTGAAVNVSCTLVTGRDNFAKTSIPKTQAFAAGANAFIIWNTTDNGGENYEDLPNLSCNLPAGVELEYVANVTVNPK